MEASTNLFDLNKDQLSVIANSIKAKLNELGFANLGFTLHKHLTLNKEADKQGFIVINGIVPSSLKDNIDKLSSAIEDILNGSDAYAIEIEPGIVEGEKFPPVRELTDISTKKRNKTLKCASGEVTLVDFWAAWCDPCQTPMQQNQEMLERNEEKWKEKARIVGISLDDDIKSAIKRIEEKKWNKVEHYHAPEGFGLPSVTQFGIQDIPCVFLVDKKGMIRFRGAHNAINLEEKINELILEGDNVIGLAENKKESKNEDTLSIDTEEELLKQFQQKHETNKHLVEKLDFTSGIIAKREFKPSGEEIYSGQALVSGLINQQDKEAVIEYWKNVIQPTLKVLSLDNKLTINNVPEIRYGTTCATCKEPLKEGVPHYICTACQSIGREDYAFCLGCADKESTKEINSWKDLFHPHGLLLLHEDSSHSLRTIKRVMNKVQLIPDTHPNFAQIKAAKSCNVRCDLCGQLPILNCRWTCANCANFDCCTNCLRIVNDLTDAKNKEIIAKGLTN